MLNASPNLKRWLQILGWACYLACSWTWCIGMFLPVLLVRDYGVWGFVVFAVPNVVGAAAMGWVLRKPGASRQQVSHHLPVLKLFSLVTVAFQTFFLWWFLRPIVSARLPGQFHRYVPLDIPSPGWSIWVWLVMFGSIPLIAVAYLEPARHGKRGLLLRYGTIAVFFLWLFSAWTGFLGITSGNLAVEYTPISQVPVGLMLLAPVIAFGFLLCPYCDLSFHRTRQALSEPQGTRSFVIGFGLFFLAMILMTLGYAHLFLSELPIETVLRTMGPFGGWLIAHIGLQLVFTIWVHSLELFVDQQRGSARIRPNGSHTIGKLVLLLSLFFVVPIACRTLGEHVDGYAGLTTNEIIYRLFLSFYGLVFPAYVWLCMIPTWRDPQKPTKRHIAVWLGACALASPCYWMGFIERVEWWLVPGLAVVLLARLLIPSASRGSFPPPAEPSPSLVPVHSGPPELSAAATPER